MRARFCEALCPGGGRHGKRRSRLALIFLAGLSRSTLPAAEPSLKHLFPVAGGQGAKVSVTASGKFDPWPVQAWVDAPGIVFKPGDKPGKFDVEVADDAPLGPHLVRFFNGSGASATRFFIVTPKPDVLDAEPNDDFRKPQKIAALPTTISGKLDKAGDVDSFAVTLKKGQAFTAWLEAYVVGSAFDGVLRVVDEKGTELAFNHDGHTLDPLLAWTAPRDGTFIVQTMGFVYPARAEVSLTGGDDCNYRLHLTDEPRHNSARPEDSAEQEPDDGGDKAQAIAVPGTVAGRIDRRGDEDRFIFTAVKQHLYEIGLTAGRDGSALDAWLKVEAKDGKQLARDNDSGGSRDPKLTWTAPADGPYVIALGDITHHGGPDYGYRLSVSEAAPTVTGAMATDVIMLKAEKPAELKVTVKRANAFKAKLVLVAKGLPEGVTAPEVDIPDKDGDVTLKLIAAPSAPAANQPIELVLREKEGGREHAVDFPLIKSTEDNGVPQGYSELVINAVNRPWLTVIVPPPPKPPAPAETKTEPKPAEPK